MKNSKVSLPLKKERLNEIINGCIPTAKEISDLAKALGVSAIWLLKVIYHTARNNFVCILHSINTKLKNSVLSSISSERA